MDRRAFLVSAGLATASVGAIRSAAATIEDVDLFPEDVSSNDTEQLLALTVTGVEHDRVTVGVDLSALAGAGVGVDDLQLVEDRSVAHGAVLIEWSIDGHDLRVVMDVEGDSDFRGEIVLTGLDTDDVDHSPGLTYAVGVVPGDEDPVYDHESGTFDVIDPDERPPVLDARPSRIEVGETEQTLLVRVRYPPPDSDELIVDVNVSGLESAGIGVEDLAVTAADRKGATVTDTGVLDRNGDRIIRVRFTPTGAERAEVRLFLELGGTDQAEPADLVYYATLGIDSEPNAPTADDHDDRLPFAVAAPREHGDAPQETPQPEPDPGDDRPGDGIPGSDDQTGFGFLAGLAGLVGAVAAHVRREGI